MAMLRLIAEAILVIWADCAEWTCPEFTETERQCPAFDTCVTDNTCNGIGTRCCAQPCGKTCVKVVKVGQCPSTSAGICERCRLDDDCDGNKKCCSGNCCMEPDKPGTCPTENLERSCVQPCTGDSTCPGDMKCCKECCRNNPRLTVDRGECPQPPPGGICVVCTTSDDCNNNMKCCSKCCRPPVFTCQTHACERTSLCRLAVVQCVTSPCLPVPQCFEHPCSTVSCGEELSCYLLNDMKSCSGENCPVASCQLGICPVGYGQPFPGIYCGRGINREDCPPGYFCNVDRMDRYAVCCAELCPVSGVAPLTEGLTIRTCTTSADCQLPYSDCITLNMTRPLQACCPSSSAAIVRTEDFNAVMSHCIVLLVAGILSSACEAI